MKPVLTLLFFTILVAVTYAGRFHLYENIDQQGNRIALDIPQGCSNSVRDYHFNDMASSINTYGQCLILCADANCQGRCVKFSAGNDNQCQHSNFGACQFNDQASSVKNC
uniref:Uncharacterized protein n=1 Tax=Panagrolaimus davidi TaxID=227884 RepID=A0A914Q0K8_9BILA